MNIKETVARYKESKESLKPGKSLMTFSPNCIGIEDCKCWRCLVDKGKEPDETTEKIAEVYSLLNKFKMNLSTLCIAKTEDDRIRTVNFAIATLKIQASFIEQLLK